jgi:hypothetical protein
MIEENDNSLNKISSLLVMNELDTLFKKVSN